ncbi:P-loop NTPase family protein, partial [Staphylococcus epidermidis]|uniref:hypothetical protein n=1 Tax=Staphylococcus epidermidis TaxID=1282 RepID=UPI001C931048
VPIRPAQPQLIIPHRQTPKTTLPIHSILNQKHQHTISIYLPIPQKHSTLPPNLQKLTQPPPLHYTILL